MLALIRIALAGVLLLSISLSASALEQQTTRAAVTIRHNGPWIVCESPHFEVWCHLSDAEATQLSNHCELLRNELTRIWLEAPARWKSRCAVVVSRDLNEYGHAIGSPGNTSVGCTTLQTSNGEVAFRRVDLRSDASTWQTSALAHELTHVILADRFAGTTLPLWADEGISILSEPKSTRLKRSAALEEAIRRGNVLSLETLLSLKETPSIAFRDSFYAQSGLLVATLIAEETPARFLEFVTCSQKVGVDRALRQVYKIEGLQALQSRWQGQMKAASRGELIEVTEEAAIAIKFATGSNPVSSRNLKRSVPMGGVTNRLQPSAG